MPLSSNRLYVLIFIACFAGYIWLYYNLSYSSSPTFSVCLIKSVTGLPCPSCGTTRSVIALLKGEFISALYLNPIGLLLAFILSISPIWIMTDLIFKKKSLYKFYNSIEQVLKNNSIKYPLILFIVGNWVWNIIKYL